MEIVLLILLGILSCIGYIMTILLRIRNNKVHEFRTYILDETSRTWYKDLRNFIIYDYSEEFDPILKKHSYEKMLYSWKPLELDYWYTEEEINKIKRGKAE